MKFCSSCGSNNLVKKIPDGDNMARQVCGQCGKIFYCNPRVICGTLPIWKGKVLLCRRAIAPKKGYWTLPAGFMENGETTEEAAARETFEEAQANIEIESLYTIFSVPRISQVYMIFKGKLIEGRHSPGAESLETKLFQPDQISLPTLAFPSIRKTLEFFIEDKKTDTYPVRSTHINQSED